MCRRVGLGQWLQSALGAFNLAGRHIVDNIDLANFLTHGANQVSPCFQLVKEFSFQVPAKPDPMSLAMPRAQHEKHSTKVTIEDFQLIKVIGKGSFGKVILVRKKVHCFRAWHCIYLCLYFSCIQDLFQCYGYLLPIYIHIRHSDFN